MHNKTGSNGIYCSAYGIGRFDGIAVNNLILDCGRVEHAIHQQGRYLHSVEQTPLVKEDQKDKSDTVVLCNRYSEVIFVNKVLDIMLIDFDRLKRHWRIGVFRLKR